MTMPADATADGAEVDDPLAALVSVFVHPATAETIAMPSTIVVSGFDCIDLSLSASSL